MPGIYRVLLVAVMLLLTGCGVETYAGVELATVPVAATSTPAPSPTPDPLLAELPNVMEKTFSGTTVTLNYPEEWQASERGQFFNIFDPAQGDENTAPGVFALIQLTRTVGLDRSDEDIAPAALLAFMRRMVEGGFAPSDSVPDPDEILAFQWTGHDAAMFYLPPEGNSTAGLSVLVMNEDHARFIVFNSFMDSSLWPSIEPTILAILSTATLDGQILGGPDLIAAYQALTTD